MIYAIRDGSKIKHMSVNVYGQKKKSHKRQRQEIRQAHTNTK